MTEEHSPPPVRRRARGAWAAIIAVSVLGAGAVAGGGVGLAAELGRAPTTAQKDRAGDREIASRWKALPAGKIFPVRAGDAWPPPDVPEYGPPDSLAHRVGIAPAAPCAEGFDRGMADILARHGCRAVLRATYVDSSGTLATTVGVAVLPDSEHAAQAESEAGGSLRPGGAKEKYGVRAVPFQGTVAAGFDDSHRRHFRMEAVNTPYLFFRSSGWLLTRGPLAAKVQHERFQFADAALSAVIGEFTVKDAPCRRQGVRC